VPAARTAALRPLLALVCAVMFVDTIFYAAITPLLPRYRDELGLSTFEAGVLAAGYPAGTLIGALPCGWLASRAGVRFAVVAGLLVMAASSLVFGFAESAPVLVAARVVQGVAGAASWAGALGWLAATAPSERRGELIGVALGAALAGALCGPALGALADATSPELVFTGVAVVGVALAAWALRTPAAPAEPAPLRRALAVLGDRRMSAAVWLVALPGLAFGTIGVLGPLRLDDLGATALAIAVIFTAAGVLEMVVNPVAGRISDRRGRLVPLMWSVAGAAVLVLALPLAGSVVALGLVILVVNPVLGIAWTPAMAMLSDGAHDRGVPQGLAFSLTNATWGVGQTVGSVGSAALAEAAGRAVPFLVLSVCCAATLTVLRAGGRRYARAA
jgi:MFS family permease